MTLSGRPIRTTDSSGSRLYIWKRTSNCSSMVASRYFCRASSTVARSCSLSKSKDSVLRLRNSPPKAASAGTALRTVPPEIKPTLKVVSSSRRPWGSSPINLGSDPDGGQSLFRLDTGVGAAALYRNVKGHIGRAGTGNGIHRPVAVKDHRFLCPDHGIVQIGGAHQANFLAPRENDLDRAAGNPCRCPPTPTLP